MKKYVIIMIIGLFVFESINSQNKMTYSNNFTSLYPIKNENNKGFELSLSAVLMFTTGAEDRNGIRWGAGLNISKYTGDFKLTTGLDYYKAKENFNIGTTFAGISYYKNDNSYSYYLTKYHQGDKQMSGIINIGIHDFQIRFEDDILSLPFTRFIVYDRYRTAAIEIRYRNFIVGTNVYTTEPNGLTDYSSLNPKGLYTTGKQISSPIYAGYSYKNMIIRSGLNNKIGGDYGQNWWHRTLFNTSDFNNIAKSSYFMQLGVDKPYTLY